MKEHMRKKGHKKINPRNVGYDKYYIVNYLEFGRSWKEKDLDDAIDEEMPNGFISDDDDQGIPKQEHAMFHSFVTDLFFLFFSGDENDWSDWRATGSGCGAICLFCPVNYMDVDELLTHMTSIHDFDFNTVRNSKRLNFYQQVSGKKHVIGLPFIQFNFFRSSLSTTSGDSSISTPAFTARKHARTPRLSILI